MAFQHVLTFQSTGRLRLTPPSTWFSRMLACAYFSPTKIGPACPTTWRPPNRGAIGFCYSCALYFELCLLGSVTAASGRFLSFRLPNRGDIVPSGAFSVCVSSDYHHRSRSPSFVQAT